jgi:ABC-type polysaccharide/polyol phosphate transport system ATPase subunit
MTSSITFTNVNLTFRKLSNVSNSLKESFVRFFLNFGQKTYIESYFNVLDNITFSAQEGDRIALIGRNGAGKSTLLRTICGIYKPQQGIVTVQGRISSLIELGVGFNPELTGRENIYLNALISGFTYQEIKEKEQEIIDFAGIGDFIDTQTKYYSTGMNMRLSFSVATIIDPDILVVDELFAGGDIDFIEKSSNRLNAIRDKAKIFIAAPHDMSYVRNYCNKIIYLKDRKIAYFGEEVERAIEQYEIDSHQH